MDCIFCNREKFHIIAENELSYAIYDKYPVNLGHVLIMPKRHFKSFLRLLRKRFFPYIN